MVDHSQLTSNRLSRWMSGIPVCDVTEMQLSDLGSFPVGCVFNVHGFCIIMCDV